MLLGYCCSSIELSSVPTTELSSNYPLQTCFFVVSLEDISIDTLMAPAYQCLISSPECYCNFTQDFFKPQQMRRQAKELTRQAKKPMKKEKFTPNVVKDQGVTNTLAISPNYGSIKMTPAYLPIQDDAICPCIMQRIQAPIPSKILPPINSQKKSGFPSPPKMATRSCPKDRAKAPNQSNLLAILVQKKPRGMMNSIEMALGIEQSKLNLVTLILCICYSAFCIV